MRYYINFDKTINQLVPYYIGGRKLILYLQALMKPLRAINDAFVSYAKETKIEATMTSQKFKFEWYLNRLFSKYFKDGGSITISNGSHTGIPIYYEDAGISDSENLLMYQESEGIVKEALYHQNEKTTENSYSFIVYSPAIDTALITEEKYRAMLSHYVDRYRLAGKTYIIKFYE